jgi:soluble lytic murein transglycosylase
MLDAAILALLLSAPPLTAADLAPLLGTRLEIEARAALDERRFGDAAAKLAQSREPGAAYLRALALVRAGRPAEALAPLQGLEARLPDLADRIAHLRGAALDGAGRPREALEAWAAVSDASLLGGEARLARARVAAAQGQRAVALAALDPLVSVGAPADLSRPDHGATALRLAGRLRAEGGDPAAARRAYLSCWSEHPLAPEAAECRTALASLPAPHGAPPAAEDALRRAEVLLDANRNQAALALLGPLLEKLPEASPEDAFSCRVRAAAGRAHRKERSHRKAIEILRPVADRCGDPEVRVRALYLLASAASISGDRQEAVALYRRLARDFSGHSFADDALFFAADILARDDRPDEAREALAQLVRDHPGGDYRDEARFRIAWLAKRAGNADAAVAQLLAIEEDRGDQPHEHARAAYWRARLLSARGEDGRRAARDIWSELVGRYPADYYGLLSRARLSEAEGGDALPPPIRAAAAEIEPASWDPGTMRADPHFRAGILLHRLGLHREAAEEFAAIDGRRLREAALSSPDAVLLVAHLLDRAGDHRSAHHLLRTRARDALRRTPEGENLRAWRIAYPPAFREDVRRWAGDAGVSVDLMQALMREESALDPRAISPAGAIGLTQLMLPTAKEVARKLRLGRVERGDLVSPSLNIRLGSRYLGDLLRRYDGSVPLALAAYNAGFGAVGRWLGQRSGLELDEFVEEIPIEETRGYVKRVLRSYAAYRLLYGAEEGETTSVLLVGTAGKG